MKHPLLTYLRPSHSLHFGPLWFGVRLKPTDLTRYYSVGFRLPARRWSLRADQALHRLLPRISPKYVFQVEDLKRLDIYEAALHQILEVKNSRVACRLHGGDVGAEDGTCDCYTAIDAADKAKEIADAALDCPLPTRNEKQC